MSWEELVSKIYAFFDQPVAIIGCSLGALCVYVLIIISKTSFGKKAIRKLNDENAKLKAQFGIFKGIMDEKQVAYQKECDKLIKEQQELIAKQQALILAIAENIHNVNVEKLLEEYKKVGVDNGKEE